MFENQLINEVTGKLANLFSEEDVRRIVSALQSSVQNYEINKLSLDIVPFQGSYVPEYYKAYLVCLKLNGKSMETIKAYDHHLMHFFRWLRVPLSKITTNDIRMYLYEYQKEHGISGCSLDNKRLALSAFLQWCVNEKYLEENPCSGIGRIKFEKKERKPLTGEELYVLRDSLTTLRDKAMLAVMYSTGCRVSELERLNIDDVKFQTGEVMLFGKGNKHRISFLNPEAKVALERYLKSRDDDNEALFVSFKKPHQRLKKAAIEARFKKLSKRAGLNRSVFPHLIRHTTATDALNRGMPVAELKELLGHVKIDTTMIYAKVSNDSLHYNHKRYVV